MFVCGIRIPYFIIKLFVRLIEVNNEAFVAGLSKTYMSSLNRWPECTHVLECPTKKFLYLGGLSS